MSEELLIREAKRRIETFKNLKTFLKIIVETVKGMDPNAEVYLFGSVAEGRSLPSSDIDILIKTDRTPGETLSELWKKGIKEPFEIHVVNTAAFKIYKRRAKLVRIDT